MKGFDKNEEALKRIRKATEENLESLDLSYLGLTTLPKEIQNLHTLKKLYLTGNQLTTLPTYISSLKRLKYLVLDRNKITKLPPQFGDLQNLQSLFLNYNRIKKLPREFGNLVNLKTLEIDNNPIISPPIEIISRGIFSIINYLQELEGEKEYLFEAKLLIVGEGGAGKTTLNKKLLDKSYQLNDEEKSTEGIEISPYYFFFDLNGKRKKFRINIWDFGGQEIYHATHQFFLTKRSLYALVSDTRKEDTDFNYWLNIVELLSDNSPLLIIQNEKQDRRKELNLRAMYGRFTNIKSVLRTNLKNNRGLKEVHNEVKHQMTQLPHIGSVLPKTWIEIRKSLEKIKSNYISLDEYLRICKNNGIKEKQRALYLSEYFHDLGVFLHFQDESLLKNLVILKTTWGTDAVYKLLDYKSVVDNYGRFKYSQLEYIWDDDKFSEKHDELLQLMKKFEIVYELEESKTFIAPQLLPINQPEFNWITERNMIVRYVYDFLPKGIMSRLIVRLNRYITNQKLVWKQGMILGKNKTSALIINVFDKNEILIKIEGVNKKDLLTIITEELDKIHFTYPRIKFEKLIQCICSSCRIDNEPHFYKYNNLLKRKNSGIKKVQCDNSFLEIKVSDLIEDSISFGIETSKEMLRELVINGRTTVALQKLEALYDNKKHVITQIARLKKLYMKINLGIIRGEEASIEENKIRVAILDLIDDLKF